VVIDAQRGEFYLGVYDLNQEDWRAVEPLRLARLEELEQRARAGERLIGPELAGVLAPGQAAFPRAVMLGKLAARGTSVLCEDDLQPIYLRETKFVKAPPARVIPS
jgi:tRNA A37 threonylcarbamoyladenosine modification protein TsaB